MPDVMLARFRNVAVLPLGMPGTYLSIVSSSESFPSCMSCRTMVTVMVLVRLPTRVRSFGVGALVRPFPLVPDVPIQVPAGDHTPAITPGNPPCVRAAALVAD
jgi:hypothetical protein